MYGLVYGGQTGKFTKPHLTYCTCYKQVVEYFQDKHKIEIACCNNNAVIKHSNVVDAEAEPTTSSDAPVDDQQIQVNPPPPAMTTNAGDSKKADDNPGLTSQQTPVSSKVRQWLSSEGIENYRQRYKMDEKFDIEQRSQKQAPIKAEANIIRRQFGRHQRSPPTTNIFKRHGR